MRNSFVNLTHASAAWFEFALFGIPTVMIHPELAHHCRVQAFEIGMWESGDSPIFELKSYESLVEYISGLKGATQAVSLEIGESLDDFIGFLETSNL